MPDSHQPDTYYTIDLDGTDYRDRVFGCWQGKNAGGTLGTPLEEAWGQDEPFDVWWYPELQEGGLPNDDFEMQLAWLKAIEDIGPGITARDLSRYWLDHIGYNFDEYGLSKRNLRLGLEPPVSGHFNNWFVDCMGSPIRSELWACLAPGVPRVAARYAYQDAICDHAGGEGVYGELFNASLESAAFVVQDPNLLIDIALSYVPDSCMVRRAVEAVREAHAGGRDWQQARRAVLDATPHYNAQYTPINTGFQVIGLLYGSDFGDGMCKTVNCGYDTDSSGAAIGSYLGIILGSAGLPAKWVAPLGNGIATNEDWGGVRHMTDGTNPVPTDLDDLTDRIHAVAKKVLRHHGLLGDGAGYDVLLDDLYADESIRALHRISPDSVPFPGPDVDVEIDYVGGPVCFPGSARQLRTRLRNNRRDPMVVDARLRTPSGWESVESHSVQLQPGQGTVLDWTLPIPAMPTVTPTNRLWLDLDPAGYPVPPSLPVVLTGAFASRLSRVFGSPSQSTEDLLNAPFPPEIPHAPLDQADARPGPWRDVFSAGYAQPIGEGLSDGGAVYLQTFVYSPRQQDCWIMVDPSCPIRYWLNGIQAGENHHYRRIRPNQSAAEGIGADIQLADGWNEVLIKIIHDGAHARPELHLGFCGPGPLAAHLYDINRCQFPWSAR